MITEKIELKRQDILDKVHEDSAYLAAKHAQDPEAWENTPLLDGEESVVTPWLDEAASKLMMACWKYMVSSDIENASAKVEIVLSMPNNWKTCTETYGPQELSKMAMRYMVEYVLGNWLAYRNAADASARLEMAKAAMEDLVSAMDARVPMTRTNMVPTSTVKTDAAILAALKDNEETIWEEANNGEQVVILNS